MTIEDNPFFVLGVAPDASRIEIEREAQKLLGMLELGFADAQTYATPLGLRPAHRRGRARGRAALRDPYRRLVAELWARHAPAPTAAAVGRARSGARRRAPALRRRAGVAAVRGGLGSAAVTDSLWQAAPRCAIDARRRDRLSWRYFLWSRCRVRDASAMIVARRGRARTCSRGGRPGGGWALIPAGPPWLPVIGLAAVRHGFVRARLGAALLRRLRAAAWPWTPRRAGLRGRSRPATIGAARRGSRRRRAARVPLGDAEVVTTALIAAGATTSTPRAACARRDARRSAPAVREAGRRVARRDAAERGVGRAGRGCRRRALARDAAHLPPRGRRCAA